MVRASARSLELARVFSTEIPRRTLLLVASDGAEWGMLGAMDIARSYSERGRIVAVISLDYVAVGEIAELRLNTVGQMGGYTPPWLRDMARRAAGRVVLLFENRQLREHLERALLISWNDQGSFPPGGNSCHQPRERVAGPRRSSAPFIIPRAT